MFGLHLRKFAFLPAALCMAIAMLASASLAATNREDRSYPYGGDSYDRDRDNRDRDDKSDTNDLDYRPAAGPYSVGEIDRIVLRDNKRDKSIPVRVFFPRADRKFPVIVFSHGAGASKENYTDLTRFWASYGYVTIQPTHDDSVGQRRRSGEDYDLSDSVRDALFDSRAWEERAKDISFVINSLPEIERRNPKLRGLMDRGKIGVGGHSLGAQTAMLVGGARVEFGRRDGLRSFRDGDVDAILAMSPQGVGQMGFTEDSWNKVEIPMMTMTGSEDQAGPRRGADWRMDAFNLSPRGDKYHVFIEGANHMTFAGSGRASKNFVEKVFGRRRGNSSDRLIEYVQIASLAFWDATLKHDRSAERYLDSKNLERLSEREVKVDVR